MLKRDNFLRRIAVIVIVSVFLLQNTSTLSFQWNLRSSADNRTVRSPEPLTELTSLRESLTTSSIPIEGTTTSTTSQIQPKTGEYSGLPSQVDNQLIESLTITSDNDFRTQAAAMGWGGTGNEFDPIVIENYNFSLNTPSTRILIQDTSLEFVIQNCVIETAANLTTFYNVSNGILKGNIFQQATSIGLFLDEFGVDNRIIHNIFENNATGGINAISDNDQNYFYFNWWDSESGSSAGGLYWNSYTVPGTGGLADQAPRVHKGYWNVNELLFPSNAQLAMSAFERGFLGNGTKENPYLIQNLNLSFAMETPLIDIQNVDYYVVIKNCYFDANLMVPAINLWTVSNLVISNCTILKGINGIFADTVKDLTIVDCSINESGSHGFYGNNMNDSVIDTLTMYNSDSEGLWLQYSNNVSILNSQMENITSTGISANAVKDLTIVDCSIIESGSHGLYGNNINDTVIDTLTMYNTASQGLWLRYSNNVSILNSQMENITFTGIFFQYSNDMKVDSCIVQNCYALNSRGIRADNVDTLSISNSIVRNISSYGIYFYYTTNSSLDNTNVSYSNIGLLTYQGGDCNFTSSTFWNHTRYGIEIDPGLGNYILSDLEVFNCDDGIVFIDSNVKPSIVTQNYVHDNNRGIYLYGQEGAAHDILITNNNISSNYETGIYVRYGVDNVITLNNIDNNYVGINCTTTSENNIIFRNIFLNNDAWDDGITNSWDNGTYGNFWDSYGGIDGNGDGFGDTPFAIAGSSNAIDKFPLSSLIDPPSIILMSPVNTSIINSETVLEILFQNSNGTFSYNWDRSDNHSLTIDELVPLPLVDGLHILNIYLSNSQSWTMAKYVFTIDNIAPVIEPWDEVEDGSELGAGTTVPFSIVDVHFEKFWYTWNNSQGILPPASSVLPWVDVPIVTGEWTLKIYANDSAGNEEFQSFTVTVLAAADIAIIYPNGGEIDGGYVNITWTASDDLTYTIQYSPDSGYSWITLIKSHTLTFYVWDTATSSVNGSSFLVRVRSTTPGKPGEIRSETTFSILNIITRHLPVGKTDIEMPDINISITVSEETNVTIQRLTQVPIAMDPNASDFFAYGLFVDIVLDNPDALEILIISFSVEHLLDTLTAQGLTIFDIGVFFYNETLHEWEPADEITHNFTLSIVIGTFNHTTTIGALGRSQEPSSSSGDFPFLLIFLVVMTLGGVAGGAMLIYDHQLKMQAGETSLLSQIEKYLKSLRGRKEE